MADVTPKIIEALYGNPPSPNHKPSRELVVEAAKIIDARLSDVEDLASVGLTWIDGGWITATDYDRNEVLTHNGGVYRATADHNSNSGNEPGVGPVDWEDFWEIVFQVGVAGITNAQLANMPENSFKGSIDPVSRVPVDLTLIQSKTVLGVVAAEVAITQLDVRADGVDGALDIVDGAILALDDRLDDAEAEITENDNEIRARVLSVEIDQAAASVALAGFDAALDDANDAIIAVDDRVDETDNDVTVLSSRVLATEIDQAATDAALVGFDAALDDANDAIMALDDRVDDAEADHDALATRVTTTENDINNLEQTSIAKTDIVATGYEARPGDNPRGFTTNITGPLSGDPITNEAGITALVDDVASMGKVIKITNVERTVSGKRIKIEAGHVYRPRVIYRRFRDPIAPSGGTFEYGVRFLKNDLTGVTGGGGNRVISSANLTVAEGVKIAPEVTFSLDIAGATYTIPATTEYADPWVRTYTTDHETHIAVVWLEDITDQFVISPGSQTEAQLSAILARLTVAEDINDGQDIEISDIQDELDTRAPIDNPAFTGTVSGVTKAMVGLGDADDTPDIDKPLSIAQQNALNNKADAGIVLSEENIVGELVIVDNDNRVLLDTGLIPVTGRIYDSKYGDFVVSDSDDRVIFASGLIPSAGTVEAAEYGDFVVSDSDDRVIFASGLIPSAGTHYDLRYGDVIIDKDNRIISYMGSTGGGGGAILPEAWSFSTVAGTLVATQAPYSISLSFNPDGSAAYASRVDTLVTYTITGGTYAGSFQTWLEAAGEISPSVNKIEYNGIMGQSLGVMAVSGPLLTVPETGPITLGNWNGGWKPSVGMSPVAVSAIRTIVQAAESTRDSPTTPFARARRADGDGQTLFFSANWAQGGTTFDEIKPGSVLYRNGLIEARRIKAWADLRALPITHANVQYMHGENAQATDGTERAAYQAKIEEYVNTYRADMIKIFGHAPMFITRQTSSWGQSSYNVARSGVPLSLLYAALENPDKIICSGPDYMLPFGSDRLHYITLGAGLRGEYNDRASRKYEQGGATAALPCYAYSVTRSGVTVKIKGNVPVAPLVIDTSTLTNPGNYGLEWIDSGDGNSVSISSVAITDNGGTGTNQEFEITVTLSDEPTATECWIGIARTTTPGIGAGLSYGPRTNFHDSAPEVSYYDPTYHMWNWMCVDQIEVILDS